MVNLIFFGAGSAGRYCLKHLGDVDCFADNDPAKQGTSIEGIQVLSPEEALQRFPGAVWVATAISRPAATEIRAQLKRMGVMTKPLWGCLNVCHGLPPASVEQGVALWKMDDDSLAEWCDQLDFRENPDYDAQNPPSNCRDIYFPNFISHRDDEVFVDCGAADGDTVRAFMERWPRWKSIIAFEPDHSNYNKMCLAIRDPEGKGRITMLGMGVSDFERYVSFASHGDYSSHVGEGDTKARLVTLDHFIGNTNPTFIKMDIEGSELEAIWGARRILKKHKPVLAICAYHTSDHLWQIPLLIHAIQPDYKLFLRRYAEGAFELVWYAVPPERMVGNQELQRRVMQELALGENE